jgi:exonuclease III
MAELSILQCNANRLFARFTELKNYLENTANLLHIICLQETRVSAKNKSKSKGTI